MRIHATEQVQESGLPLVRQSTASPDLLVKNDVPLQLEPLFVPFS